MDGVNYNFGTYLTPRYSSNDSGGSQIHANGSSQNETEKSAGIPPATDDKQSQELHDLRALNRLEKLQRKKAEAQAICLENEVVQLRRRLATARNETSLSPTRAVVAFQSQEQREAECSSDRVEHLERRLTSTTERFRQDNLLLANRKEELEEELDRANASIQMHEKNLLAAEETIDELERELAELQKKLTSSEEATAALALRYRHLEAETGRKMAEEDETKLALEKRVQSLVIRENKLIRSVAEIQFFNENGEISSGISKIKSLVDDLNHAQSSLLKREMKYKKARQEFHVKAAALLEEKEETARQCQTRVQYLEAVVQDLTRRAGLHKDDAAKIAHLKSLVKETKAAAREEKKKMVREFEMTIRDLNEKIDRGEEYGDAAFATIDKLKRQIQIQQGQQMVSNVSSQAPHGSSLSPRGSSTLELVPSAGEASLLARVLEAVTLDLERSCERYTALKHDYDILSQREQNTSAQFQIALETLAESQSQLERAEAALEVEQKMRDMFRLQQQPPMKPPEESDTVVVAKRKSLLALALAADHTLTETTRALFALMNFTAEEKRKNSEAVEAMAIAAEAEMSRRVADAIRQTREEYQRGGSNESNEELRLRMHGLTRHIVELCVGLEMAVLSDRHMASELLRVKENELHFWRQEAIESKRETENIQRAMQEVQSQQQEYFALTESRTAQLEQHWQDSLLRFEMIFEQRRNAGESEGEVTFMEKLARAEKAFWYLESAVKAALRLDYADPDKVFGLVTIHEETDLEARLVSMTSALHLLMDNSEPQFGEMATAIDDAAMFEARDREFHIQSLEEQLRSLRHDLENERHSRSEERETMKARMSLMFSQLQQPC